MIGAASLARLVFVLVAQGTTPAAQPATELTVEDGSITLADGTKLAHVLVRPEGEGPWPVLLVRSCYIRRASVARAQPFVAHGVAVMVQDARGTGDSGGEWRPFLNEPRDGAETFDWVIAQPWCNGTVAVSGASYLAVAHWQLAPHAGPRLAGMVSHFASADVYRDVIHFGGVQGLAIALGWSLTTSGGGSNPRLRALPLIDADDASGRDLEVWNDWCRHPLLDEYWKELDFAPRYADVTAPALLIAGWYDLFQPGQVDDYMELAKRLGPPERSFTRLIVGPWDHGGPDTTLGRPDLGPDAYRPPFDEERLFLDRFLRGTPNGYEYRDGVRAFVLGANEWRELPDWPPPDADATAFFLRSLGGAAKKPGDGMLFEGRPPTKDEKPDEYVYDPRFPCPSYATSLWTPLSSLSDLAQIAEREDVLVYQTPPLAKDVTIAGPVELEVWIECDAPDTDIAATLVDIGPEDAQGHSLVEWRGEGIQRARVRDDPTRETLLEPGVPARLVVRMGHMAALFRAGHRIGLHLTSSNFPRFSRNLNTAEPSNVAAEPRTARVRVLHGPQHPSRLVLWTVPSR